MWPRTQAGEAAERRRRRRREIELVMRRLGRLKPEAGDGGGATVDAAILEVGTGNGYQLPHLRRLGRVVASDIHLNGCGSEECRPFVVCDIARAPFRDGSFDMVFSNHVLQSVTALEEALGEMRRLCRTGGLAVAVVPTSLWVWLSVPYRYWDRVCHVVSRLCGRRGGPRSAQSTATTTEAGEAGETGAEPGAKGAARRPADSNGRVRGWRKLLPEGLGRYPGFWEFHRRCRARAWRGLFEAAGFEVTYEEGLLMYAPSGWPIVPTNRIGALLGASSSRLYVLRRRAERGVVKPCEGGPS